MNTKEFLHIKLNEEIQSISGHMVFQKEERISVYGKEVLYLVGYSITDSSCCGIGGCVFSFVPGYIINWHNKTSEQGGFISEVEPITDKAQMNDIMKIIMQKEHCTQVNFM